MMGFNNIIGHLKNAIESGKISHSYIFTGEPGSGKKLLAGTFAATLQCEAGGTEPCQKCDSCKKAIGKNHPDIIMVTHEKPGTISIDEIRDQVIHDVDIRLPVYSLFSFNNSIKTSFFQFVHHFLRIFLICIGTNLDIIFY